ncbi:Alanine dehydrogenase [Thioalkalivibrio nitratireducens DSM 14787]|uniref:Alanine dehydrogenase n=1 Tax=Thioalkalivibrio nitratireducens (strain DSM 14787 / UNIQEM 213 / ALEN2) TaxID=1255043 RepID=L0DYL5_THIND|nr:alanine dehydrogenase [Thioalkalivibrio nitratireducens]AGA34689.1 Alanine dehydrogenase [Thioalkalivibrio nitratireducens DSM 14787]
MIIGVPREIKNNEFRVGMTPAGVAEFVAHGHTVLVEHGAGEGSSFPDEDYAAAGARLVGRAAELFGEAELVVKVKEPQPSEMPLLRTGQVLFAFLHLAPDRSQTERLVRSGAVCIAYETVELPDGRLPLLAPMSEVAGRMSAQVGAALLQRPNGGRGVLMGGVPGVPPANVLILGAGSVGCNAAYVARGMGANVSVMDVDLDRLRQLDRFWGNTVHTLHSNRHDLERQVSEADLVIGAVLVAGARTPVLVTRKMVAAMKPRAVVVDVSVDQGGCVETSRPTSHDEPSFLAEDVLHYAVTNMPGAVPYTSTLALTHATLRHALALADRGWRQAVQEDPALARGVNVLDGQITHRTVADAHGMDFTSLTTLLA